MAEEATTGVAEARVRKQTAKPAGAAGLIWHQEGQRGWHRLMDCWAGQTSLASTTTEAMSGFDQGG